MPATQELEYFDGLKFVVEPVDPPDPVYFTDDRPEFDVTIINDDSKYDFGAGSKFTWVIQTEPFQEIYSETAEFGPLERGESETVRIGGRVLAYDGHGTIGISISGASGGGEDSRRKLSHGKRKNMDPAYSYRVWDKSDYEASVRRPRELQKALIYTSIVLIAFAAVQILVSLGIPTAIWEVFLGFSAV